MKFTLRVACAASVCLWSSFTVSAEPVVTIDHNASDASEVDFRFKTVPAPRRSAAIGAAVSIVDGTPDPKGASPGVLHNGEMPSDEDQPHANFYFWGPGGRVRFDLGKIIPVQEVDTYSWHSDVRAPQVYKLYGSDGNAPGFVAEPKRPQDPAAAGWKLLATVDSRTRFGGEGGQYGVSVAEAAGPLGRYRYLLFDVGNTETADLFGNTFFSEIVVLDADSTDHPPLVAKTESKTYEEGGLRLVFTSDEPTFDPFIQEQLAKTFFKVYPEMMKEYNPQASKTVRISVERRYHGVAATMGTHIVINPDWYRRYPKDYDVVTHEGMHVVQAYPGRPPFWMQEGIADYARYKFGVNNGPSGWTMPDYQPDQKYTDAYRITARFLAWMEKHVKPGIVVTLDSALRNGTYSADTWKQQTGKTVDELWADYGKNPAL